MGIIMRTIVKVKVHRLTCQRCRHEWVPRGEDVRQCPKCKSARWDEPRPEAVAQVEAKGDDA